MEEYLPILETSYEKRLRRDEILNYIKQIKQSLK